MPRKKRHCRSCGRSSSEHVGQMGQGCTMRANSTFGSDDDGGQQREQYNEIHQVAASGNGSMEHLAQAILEINVSLTKLSNDHAELRQQVRHVSAGPSRQPTGPSGTITSSSWDIPARRQACTSGWHNDNRKDKKDSLKW